MREEGGWKTMTVSNGKGSNRGYWAFERIKCDREAQTLAQNERLRVEVF